MRISIVTPSFQQVRFLERSMRSVLRQEVTDLEYMVLDAGSSDGSVDTIKKYGDRLAYWRSRPDGGYADAVQEGFSRATGEIMGWLNSDDMLTPWALRTVESVFRALPEVRWLTTRFMLMMDETDTVIACRRNEGYHSQAFYRGRNHPVDRRFYTSVIQQESTFWRRDLWEQAGAHMDAGLKVAGDFELWARFFRHAELYALNVPLGCFRFQQASITSTQMQAYDRECKTVLDTYHPRFPKRGELFLRRMVRKLPQKFRSVTGLAYPVHLIGQAERGNKWRAYTEWIV
jgi:glycosyltransferase involved in cell wall biosynthesis